MSTGSERDGLVKRKVIVSPVAAITSKRNIRHLCAEMSLREISEGGTTHQGEGESMETAVQPRNGKNPQAFIVPHLITAGKVISSHCKSLVSVYPGTRVALGCSSWGHQPTASATGSTGTPAACTPSGQHSEGSAPASPHRRSTALRMGVRPPDLRLGTGRLESGLGLPELSLPGGLWEITEHQPSSRHALGGGTTKILLSHSRVCFLPKHSIQLFFFFFFNAFVRCH